MKPVQPPTFKKQRGRPKKMRHKKPEEYTVHGSTTRKLTRHYTGMTCTNYGVQCHNKVTCAHRKQSATTEGHV